MLDLEALASRVSASSEVESAREVVSQLGGVLRGELRAWGEFFEHLSPGEVLGDGEAARRRLGVNLAYYRANYAVACGAVLAGTAALVNVRVLPVAAVSAVEALWLFELRRRRPVVVLGRKWGASDKANALVGSTAAWALLAGALAASLAAVVLAATLVLGHAVLRPRSTRSRFSSFGASASLEVGSGIGIGSGVGSGASASFAGVSRGFFSSPGPALPQQPELPETDSFSIEYVEEMRKQEYELRRARNSEFTRRRAQMPDRRAAAQQQQVPAQSQQAPLLPQQQVPLLPQEQVPLLPQQHVPLPPQQRIQLLPQQQVSSQPPQQAQQQRQPSSQSSPACDSEDDEEERKAADEAPMPVKVRVHVPARVVTLASKKVD